MKKTERTDEQKRRDCVILGGLSLACGILALLWKAVFCFPGVVLAAVCLGRLSRLEKPGPGEKAMDRSARLLAVLGGLLCLLVVMAFTVQLTQRADIHLF